jgi:hypothetical protein
VVVLVAQEGGEVSRLHERVDPFAAGVGLPSWIVRWNLATPIYFIWPPEDWIVQRDPRWGGVLIDRGRPQTAQFSFVSVGR